LKSKKKSNVRKLEMFCIIFVSIFFSNDKTLSLKTFVIFLLIMTSVWSAFAQNAVVLDDAEKVYVIGRYTSFFLDSTGRLNVEDLMTSPHLDKFTASASDVPNLKNTKAAVWMRFETQHVKRADWMFEFAAPYIDTVSFYKVVNDSVFEVSETGAAFPFKQREVSSPNFTFTLRPDANLYFLRIRTDLNPQFPTSIMTKNRLIAKNQTADLLNGIYFGFIILIVLYNFFIWVSSREPIYIYYVFYAFAIGLLIAMNKGYAFKYVWSEAEFLNRYLYTVAPLLSISSILFTVKFLDMKKYTPVMHKILLGFVFVFVGVMAIDLSGNFRLSGVLSKNLSSLLTVIIFPVVISIYKKGHKPALFFLIAWSFYVVGALVHLLRLQAVLPYNSLTANALQIGSAFEMVLLSFAVADLLNRLKRENVMIIKNQNIKLEHEVKLRTAELVEKQEEITQQNHELFHQKEIIEESHKHITDSINYAKSIQKAVFPQVDLFTDFFADAMVFNRPRDVVSGDFYWAKQFNDKLFFCVTDCTGHGVPGALVGMLGISLYNEVCQNEALDSTAKILDELRLRLKSALKQSSKDAESKDGMDTAFCIFDKKTRHLQFSGAYNCALILRDNELIALTADKQPIGFYAKEKPFTSQEIGLQPNDCLYLFSDGITDQFHEKTQEKFKINRFKDLILSLAGKPMREQFDEIQHTFNTWRGSAPQTDDVLVLGLKV